MPAKKSDVVELKSIKLEVIKFKVVGDSPLIMHAWSEKAKREMLEKQMKKAKTAKPAKNPQEDYEQAFYRNEKGEPAFPTIAFKQAAVSAGGRFSDGLKMTELRGSFFIIGELVKIEGKPQMREDMVRVGMGTADIRYRPEFKKWSAVIEIKYNADKISAEQIINLFNLAGFGVGVGEWRPEKDGQYGMFHVEEV